MRTQVQLAKKDYGAFWGTKRPVFYGGMELQKMMVLDFDGVNLVVDENIVPPSLVATYLKIRFSTI